MAEIIAEIGWNHMGDMSLAENMVKEAASAGCSYAKFQTWSVDRLKSGSWDTDGRRDIYNKAQLSKADHVHLINICDKYNISFLSSAFSVPDAQLLLDLGQRAIKIPSFELTNVPLLKFVSNNFDTIFLSTGASTLEEIKSSVSLLSSVPKLVLMHCVSSYPCPVSIINLPRLNSLKNLSNNIGFSDHTEGNFASVFSLSYGVSYIERHFTTDPTLPGRDNKFAATPSIISQLSEFIRNYQQATVDLGTDFNHSELDSRTNYRGRFNG